MTVDLKETKKQLIATASPTNAAVIGLWFNDDLIAIVDEFTTTYGRPPSGDQAVAFRKARERARGWK